jgi:hypothetical protein
VGVAAPKLRPGIRPALWQRRSGDYELTRLLSEGEDWQDWEGQHIAARVRRRIRLSPFPPTGSDEARRSARAKTGPIRLEPRNSLDETD